MAGKLVIKTRRGKETEALAGVVATMVTDPESVWLLGEVGSGKTTFCRGFIHALGYSGNVKSPTYTLVEHYPECFPRITHFDCYRLNHNDEFMMLGAEMYFNNSLCLIEWPEQMVGALPKPALKIFFSHSGFGRKLQLEPQNLCWQERLARLELEMVKPHSASRQFRLPGTDNSA